MNATVFLCFRRKDWALAHLIARDLEDYIDAQIIMDDRTIDGEHLEAQLLPKVHNSAALLVVVTNNTFEEERIGRHDDRVRRILRAGLEARRPILPIYADGARPRYNLPEDIRAVAWADGVTLAHISYQATLEKLANLMALQVGVARKQQAVAVAAAGGFTTNTRVSVSMTDHTEDSAPLKPRTSLPLLEWVNLPNGTLTMQTVAAAFEVAPFAISRYPVTNEQYQMFIDDLGYSDQRWWEGLIYPREVELPPRNRADHPVINITWHEAVAFCRWLSHKTGLDLSLPTEAQWQWASHGEARTNYPWGEAFDLSRCNIKESGIGGTTPVMQYPSGVSPFGVSDLSGNVWEWTRSEFDSPDKDATLKITSPTLRGGSFEERMKHVRTTSRARYYPHLRRHDLGFRVASRTWVSE